MVGETSRNLLEGKCDGTDQENHQEPEMLQNIFILRSFLSLLHVEKKTSKLPSFSSLSASGGNGSHISDSIFISTSKCLILWYGRIIFYLPWGAGFSLDLCFKILDCDQISTQEPFFKPLFHILPNLPKTRGDFHLLTYKPVWFLAGLHPDLCVQFIGIWQHLIGQAVPLKKMRAAFNSSIIATLPLWRTECEKIWEMWDF